jgi:hypothetical protein
MKINEVLNNNFLEQLCIVHHSLELHGMVAAAAINLVNS